MPTYEMKCRQEGCSAAGVLFETLLRHWDDPNPNCPHCGTQLERQLAAPKCIWMKNWAEYGIRTEKDKQCPNWTPEGIWAYRTKSTRNADGSKEKVMLRTHSEMRSYCRDEGLIPPDDVNSNAEVSKDGHGLTTHGVQGTWI